MMMRNLVALSRVVGMNQVKINRTVTMSILMMVKRAHQNMRKSVVVNITVMEEVVMMKNKAALSRAMNMSIVAPSKIVIMKEVLMKKVNTLLMVKEIHKGMPKAQMKEETTLKGKMRKTVKIVKKLRKTVKIVAA